MAAFEYNFAIAPCLGVDCERIARQLKTVGASDNRPAWGWKSFSIAESGGPIIVAVIEGSAGSITGQIAVKMALDAIVENSQIFCERKEKAAVIAQSLFKAANQALYDYGCRMFGGGKVTASGLVGVYDGQKMSVV